MAAVCSTVRCGYWLTKNAIRAKSTLDGPAIIQEQHEATAKSSRNSVTPTAGKVLVIIKGKPALIDEAIYKVLLQKGKIRPIAEFVPSASTEKANSDDNGELAIPDEDAETS